jgi:hypothetical protein
LFDAINWDIQEAVGMNRAVRAELHGSISITDLAVQLGERQR